MKKQNTITTILLILILAGIVFIGFKIHEINDRQITMENNLKAYFQTTLE